MSFRRCLSGGGDIFSKSVERQGGANRTFKASGCCHGWQLEPCLYGLEPLLTFRQKIPTGRPYIEEGHSVRRGRSWGLRQPYVTNHAPRFINVSQKALHIYWQFSAMSHAIHKIVSKKRCQSYFISRRSPHHGISKDSDLCASAHRCL